MERTHVTQWVAAYERLWQDNAVDDLQKIFTDDAVYSYNPYRDPMVGLEAIQEFWPEDEEFTMTSELVAVDGDTAVARIEVRYGEPVRQEYRDLWVMRFGPDGRCEHFEEWPFWPGKGHSSTATED